MDILNDDTTSNAIEDNVDIPVKLYDAWEHRFEENDKFKHEDD